MTRSDKFRRGGLIAWAIGAFFSGSLLYSLSPYKGYVAFAVCVILAIGVQYLLTIVESVLVYGEIPHPFHKDATVTHKWIWAGAFVCLGIDAYINYNGVASLLTQINETNTLTENDLNIINGAAILLSVMIAMAPELCNAYADILEGKGKIVSIKQKDKLPFQEDMTLVNLRNQNDGLKTRIKELEGRLKQDDELQIEDNFIIGRRKK